MDTIVNCTNVIVKQPALSKERLDAIFLVLDPEEAVLSRARVLVQPRLNVIV